MIDKDTLLDNFEENLRDALHNTKFPADAEKHPIDLIRWCEKRAKLALDQTIELIKEEKAFIQPVYTRQGILEAADKCTTQDRNIEYGEPEDNFAAVAAEWQTHLDRRPPGPLNEHDVTIMMIGFKMVRSTSNPAHMDNYIDIAGYAACGGEIAGKKKTEPLDWVTR